MSQLAKRVSNYELFYDLVFVMATSSMVGMFHHVGEHQSIGWYEILQFVITNLSIWGLWASQNVYMNKYSRRDRNDIYSLMVSMLLIGNLSLVMTADWRTGHIHFNGLTVPQYVIYNGLLVAAYGIIWLQYWLHSRRYQVKTADMVLQMKLMLMNMAILVLTTVVVGLLPVGEAPYVFVVAYLFIMGVPVLLRHRMDHDAVNFPHLVERMQLITILTFGEAVIGVIRSYPLNQEWTLAVLIFATLGFAFINYISQTAIGIDHHQQSGAILLVFTHLALLVGVNLFTVGVELLPTATDRSAILWLMVIALGLYHGCLLLTSYYNKEELRLTPGVLLQYGLVFGLGAILVLVTGAHLLVAFACLAAMEFGMTRVGYYSRRDWIRENIKF